MRMSLSSRLIAPCMMFILLLTGGHQGYVAYKDYKRVVNKLANVGKKVKKEGDEGKAFALFTAAVVQPTQQVAAKPLNAEVQGIIASDESWLSFAMIKTGSGQHSYREGDKLDGYDDTWIEEIRKDDVVVHYKGASQVLALKRPAYFKGISDNPPVAKPPKYTEIVDLHLNDYFVLKPVLNNGQLQGFQINPRNASGTFSQAGFKQGDVVVKVDSADMTQKSQAKNVIAEWSKMKAAEIVVLRNAHLQNIKVNVLNH